MPGQNYNLFAETRSSQKVGNPQKWTGKKSREPPPDRFSPSRDCLVASSGPLNVTLSRQLTSVAAAATFGVSMEGATCLTAMSGRSERERLDVEEEAKYKPSAGAALEMPEPKPTHVAAQAVSHAAHATVRAVHLTEAEYGRA